MCRFTAIEAEAKTTVCDAAVTLLFFIMTLTYFISKVEHHSYHSNKTGLSYIHTLWRRGLWREWVVLRALQLLSFSINAAGPELFVLLTPSMFSQVTCRCELHVSGAVGLQVPQCEVLLEVLLQTCSHLPDKTWPVNCDRDYITAACTSIRTTNSLC